MSVLSINGGRRLCGNITVQGAKNSVLPILAATLLNRGRCEIHNCPRLTDVDSAIDILRHLGCSAQRSGDTVSVDSSGMTGSDIPEHLMRGMRSSVIFLGAILARTGRAELSTPGGCELGPRPIDLHMAALRSLGAEIIDFGGKILCKAHALVGRDITLAFPSVGATENIMLAAVCAKGTTRIINAACEPEIADLAGYLRAMGAEICGAGTSVVTIDGGRPLHGCEYTVMPDRIVAATYLAAAAATSGSITVEKCVPGDISAVLAALEAAGCGIKRGADSVKLDAPARLRGIRTVRTMPHPGFPTDAQAPLMAALTVADGVTMFVENIFENRYRHVPQLARMGADIKTEGRAAVVCGVEHLHSADVEATDLRGGAAAVIAALAAEGRSTVREIGHIDRGYESLETALGSLGADMERN